MTKSGFVALLAAFTFAGCPSKDGPAAPESSGPRIGDHCTPEDGWPSKAPPTVPVVDDDVRLPPGVPYCVTRLPWRPKGFFTSNCKKDSDCPPYAMCDTQTWCSPPCTKDTDCERGLFCPPTEGTRFCRESCPVEQPVEEWGCLDFYSGPRSCVYQKDGGAPVMCECSPRPMNNAVWICSIPKHNDGGEPAMPR